MLLDFLRHQKYVIALFIDIEKPIELLRKQKTKKLC